jgi:uncharacterized damage-inducible protein DinB
MRTRSVSASSAPAFIADQLLRAFDGSAWHGHALLELLADVDAATAAAKPLRRVHNIWELVLHIAGWDRAVQRRLGGEKLQLAAAENFPVVPKPTQANWRRTLKQLRNTHAALVKTVAALPDSRLRGRVPGKKYDFHFMLHGVMQHELYHAGQIAILRKALRRTRR